MTRLNVLEACGAGERMKREHRMRRAEQITRKEKMRSREERSLHYRNVTQREIKTCWIHTRLEGNRKQRMRKWRKLYLFQFPLSLC